MDTFVTSITPVIQIIWYVALAFGLLSLVGAAKQYIETKAGTHVNIEWSQVVQFAYKAVLAVKQIYQTRPDGITDAEWDSLRYTKAEGMVIAFASSIGLHIDKDFLISIKAVIESIVHENKVLETSKLLPYGKGSG